MAAHSVSVFGRLFAVAAFCLSLTAAYAALAQSSVNPPANAVQNVAPESNDPQAGAVPGGTLGTKSDADIWRAIRGGVQGTVSIPDKKAGLLVQSAGESWRDFRNGPLPTYGAWAMGGVLVLLALFFLIRGRIPLQGGPSGVTISRFTTIERAGHWLLASSFILLGLTGLNLLYGRQVLIPVIGRDAFAALAIAGKYAHNYVGFAFMAGLIMIFAMWVLQNLPNRHDLIWLVKGGGIFANNHPPAKKFNAGQKILFWLVMLTGVSLSLSGLALLFPFEFHLFGKTFAFVNAIFGTDLPTDLKAVQEMQLSQLWHAALALLMVVVVLGHIYIGTIGMEGAFDAMGSGEVDLNWAKQHHSIWTEETMAHGQAAQNPVPAE